MVLEQGSKDTLCPLILVCISYLKVTLPDIIILGCLSTLFECTIPTEVIHDLSKLMLVVRVNHIFYRMCVKL